MCHLGSNHRNSLANCSITKRFHSYLQSFSVARMDGQGVIQAWLVEKTQHVLYSNYQNDVFLTHSK